MSAKNSIALRLALLAAFSGHVDAARMKRKSQVHAVATCPSTTNTIFKKEHRIDCNAFEDHVDSRHWDENKRREACVRSDCCWSPLEHGSNFAWCFEAPLCPAYVDPAQRKDCAKFLIHEDVNSGDRNARGRACEAQGCCWQPLEEGSAEPWCFEKDEKQPADKPQRKSPIEEKPTPEPPADNTQDEKEYPGNHEKERPDGVSCGSYPDYDEKTGICVDLETDEEKPEHCCGGGAPQEIVSERQQEKYPEAEYEEPVIVSERQQDHDISDVDDHEDVVAIDTPQVADNLPGTVVVYVDRAKNLPDTDNWGAGKTDAFVLVTVGGESKSTAHKGETLNPQWNEQFSFHIGAGDALVRLEVKDHDAWFNYWWDGHDDIHTLEVSFRGLEPGREYLYTEYMGKETGNVHHDASIQFRLKWNPDH